jgi:hypothetical protein
MKVEIVRSTKLHLWMRLKNRLSCIDELSGRIARQRLARELNITALHKTIAEAEKLRAELRAEVS